MVQIFYTREIPRHKAECGNISVLINDPNIDIFATNKSLILYIVGKRNETCTIFQNLFSSGVKSGKLINCNCFWVFIEETH